MLFSVSGNSKPGQDRSEGQAPLNPHGFQRIFEFRAAVTAHLICLALQREHTAEVNVVTPKQEIKDSQEDCHETPLLRVGRLFDRVISCERRTAPFPQMNKVNEQVQLH
jgi:hypothetical protein